jgi:hypothetical protein
MSGTPGGLVVMVVVETVVGVIVLVVEFLKIVVTFVPCEFEIAKAEHASKNMLRVETVNSSICPELIWK